MFDIGWGELVVIGIVALVVIGPKELPTVMRTMGQWMTKIRRMASEFQGQFQEAMRESELADLKKQIDSLKDTTNNLDFNPVETARKEIEGALEEKPKTAEPEPAMAEAQSSPATASEGDATSEAAATPSTAPASEVAASPSFDVPPPDPLPPLTEKDFAPETPPPAPPSGGHAA
ncbi:MAG: twin-arginine translocase subunit TatB [Rhizobiales bacterium]|jgi:sec-independent protein translocase protein TatB|nr:twin-arginine translocase subunit TatB [Hyphomicrobiales bacterium]